MDDRFVALTEGAYQDRSELAWLHENHLTPHRPKRIIEIGVAQGGTTRLFLDLCGPEGRVVGIDISKDLIARDVLEHPRFHLELGSSSSKEVLTRVKALMPECDLLLIDGDHTEQGVLADTECYLPLVREGGLVIWHDVQLESPSGIKATWYGKLKRRFAGAIDYFVDPFNTGYGLWYKSAASGAATAEPALGRPHEHLRRALDADPADAKSWALLLRAMERDPATLRSEIVEQLLLAVAACKNRPECQSEYSEITRKVASRICRTLSRSQRWAELPALLERLLELDPQLAELVLVEANDGLYWLSQRTHDLTAHGPAYERAFQRALESAGEAGEATRVRMARTLRYEQRWDAAAQLCRESVTRAPLHFEVKKELAGSLLDAGRQAAAHQLYRELYEQRPRDVDVQYHLVASAAAGDELAARVKEEVLAVARQGREPLVLDDQAEFTVLEALEQHGYVVIKRALEPTTVAQLRAWTDDIAACLTADGGRLPAKACEALMAELRQKGLLKAAHHYLGEFYWHPDSFARAMGAAYYAAWHQDGRTSNSPSRYCTYWLALDACGLERPGLELVTYPFRSFCPAGPAKAPRAPYDWSMIEDLIIPETRFAPVFEPGDLLIFNKYIPHGTQIVSGAPGTRRSIDFRLHAKSRED
jgi:DNA-binding SARP family transcriptional activator